MELLFILILIILFSVFSKKKTKNEKKYNQRLEKKSKLSEFSKLRSLHLLELKLNFNNKKVLDIGSINGNFSKILSKLNCDVTLSTPDDNIYQKLSKKYKVVKLNIENKADFSQLEYYDYILCYDVLEHIENPVETISNMASITDTIIVESSFSNYFNSDILNIKNEKSKNTSLNSIGSRFSRDTIYKILNNHFDLLYSVKKLPKHPSYHNDWQNIDYTQNLSQNSRDIIIASKKNILNKNLEFGLIKKHY